MASYDFDAHRLFVDAPLAEQAQFDLNQTQANYVRNVLRLPQGGKILVFNGCDGEWEAIVAAVSRRSVTLRAVIRTRPQTPSRDLSYLFAPLKQARQDYMVEKAVEMGASRLCPVLTSRTQVSRVNASRMRAHAIEAAEQCGILSIPEIAALAPLGARLPAIESDRLLVFCDEDAPLQDPCAVLSERAALALPERLAVLVGPEGGFDPKERQMLLGLPNVVRLPLGPRILRADTAAVAALALVQAVLGDWKG